MPAHSPSPRDSSHAGELAAARRRQQQMQDHDSGIFDMSEDEEPPAELRVHTLAASTMSSISSSSAAAAAAAAVQSPPRLLHSLPAVGASVSGFEYISRSRMLGSVGASSPLTASPKSAAASPAGAALPTAKRPAARMRASWLTDSFVESRRQSFIESVAGAAAAAAGPANGGAIGVAVGPAAAGGGGTGAGGGGGGGGAASSIAPSSRRSSFVGGYGYGYGDNSGIGGGGGGGGGPLVEIFEPGERLGPGLIHDGHPIQIAHTSEGFRAQDRDDSGSQLEIVRKLGEGSYAVVYLVREIIPLPADSQDANGSGRASIDDMDQYSRTLRASDSPWSSPYPPTRKLPPSKPTGRKFALKCLCKRHLDSTHLEIQRLEATIHQSIGFHPNIVTLYRVYETPDWLFLVLEYCPGQDLYYWLERSQDTAGGLTPAGSIYRGDISSELSSPSRDLSPKPLPSLHSNEPWDMDEDLENTPPNPSLLGSTSNLSLLSRRRLRLVSRMFRQMCDAVQFCHDKGISHRDLKPENFIVEDRRWFFDWEEEEDAYDNDELISGDDRADPRLNVNLLAATPTAASVLDQRRFRSPDGMPGRPSPSRSASSFNRGGQSSRESKVVVKLTDFGLATADEQCRDFDCGSKPYMAFECANDTAPYYDAKQADIWSLGVCLLNLIFHRSPFTEPNAERCESFASFCYDPIKFLTEAFEGLTQDAAEFLAKKVFCEISDKYPGRTRVSAKAFADWAENLPEHMGLASTDASRVLTRGPDPNVTSPLSHSRAGSFSSYLPFTFDAASSAFGPPETVLVEDLPEYLANVELPEELGDSTYIQHHDQNGDSTKEGERNSSLAQERTSSDSIFASEGDATLGGALERRQHSEERTAHHSDSTEGNRSEINSPVMGRDETDDDAHSGAHAAEDGSEDDPSLAKRPPGTKPRRRKRGARKGRAAAGAKVNGEPVPNAPVQVALPELSPFLSNGTHYGAVLPSAAQRDQVIVQLAAASQQLARDLSKMKVGAPTVPEQPLSGHSTAVPPSPLSGSVYFPAPPASHLPSAPFSLHQNGATDYTKERLSSAAHSDQEPEEVLATHTEHAQRQTGARRPLNPGLTKPTSWRDRDSATSSFNSNSTLSSHSGTASTHSTASAPAGLPGPRHRPADLKMGDKAVDVSYLAAVFNGVKDKMSSSQLLGGLGRNKSNGNTPGTPQHGRPSPHTASAPARHVQMPASVLRSAVGAPAPRAMPAPEAVYRQNGRPGSAGHGSDGSNDLTGARPQWRDHTVSAVAAPSDRVHVRAPDAPPPLLTHSNNFSNPKHLGPGDFQPQSQHPRHQIQQQHPNYNNQNNAAHQKALSSRVAPPHSGGPAVGRGNHHSVPYGGHHQYHHGGSLRNDRPGAANGNGGGLTADAVKSWRRG
ncbi:hypothetical protein OC844_006744 [Tilletia horrida]|nr:hypothetical protein OC844_006744 [Tilletia horrida]